MEGKPALALANGAGDLSKAEPFALGPLLVDPPSRRVGVGALSEMLEPRVMRVLVALGDIPGKVLSRDDLIELCWDGQIVSDKAITRATSLLRHALDDMTGGAVRLETIPRVGFRLLVDGQEDGGIPSGKPRPGVAAQSASTIQEPEAVGGTRRWSRRAATVGLVMAGGGAAAIGYAGWLRTRRYVPDPRAAELYRRGQAMQKDGVPESMGEAIAAYKQAVAIDPRYAEAWGALAFSYNYPVSGHVALSDPQQVRAAAQRALALDPGNADARLALIAENPLFRRWQEREVQLRGFLRDHLDSALGHVMLGTVLLNVGRFEDAVAVAERANRIDGAAKNGWFTRAFAYYLSGRDTQGDTAIEELRSRWPQDPAVYTTGYFYILGSKRFDEALAYLRDTGRRPRLIRPGQAESWMRLAEALAAGRGVAEIENWARTQPAAVRIQGLPFGAIVMALAGMVDELFALLEAFYFGGEVNGTRVPPPGPRDWRNTHLPFNPALAGLRGDPRFASLLERTGLEEYWRKSGTQPDFRRG